MDAGVAAEGDGGAELPGALGALGELHLGGREERPPGEICGQTNESGTKNEISPAAKSTDQHDSRNGCWLPSEIRTFVGGVGGGAVVVFGLGGGLGERDDGVRDLERLDLPPGPGPGRGHLWAGRRRDGRA